MTTEEFLPTEYLFPNEKPNFLFQNWRDYLQTILNTTKISFTDKLSNTYNVEFKKRQN